MGTLWSAPWWTKNLLNKKGLTVQVAAYDSYPNIGTVPKVVVVGYSDTGTIPNWQFLLDGDMAKTFAVSLQFLYSGKVQLETCGLATNTIAANVTEATIIDWGTFEQFESPTSAKAADLTLTQLRRIHARRLAVAVWMDTVTPFDALPLIAKQAITGLPNMAQTFATQYGSFMPWGHDNLQWTADEFNMMVLGTAGLETTLPTPGVDITAEWDVIPSIVNTAGSIDSLAKSENCHFYWERGTTPKLGKGTYHLGWIWDSNPLQALKLALEVVWTSAFDLQGKKNLPSVMNPKMPRTWPLLFLTRFLGKFSIQEELKSPGNWNGLQNGGIPITSLFQGPTRYFEIPNNPPGTKVFKVQSLGQLLNSKTLTRLQLGQLCTIILRTLNVPAWLGFTRSSLGGLLNSDIDSNSPFKVPVLGSQATGTTKKLSQPNQVESITDPTVLANIVLNVSTVSIDQAWGVFTEVVGSSKTFQIRPFVAQSPNWSGTVLFDIETIGTGKWGSGVPMGPDDQMLLLRWVSRDYFPSLYIVVQRLLGDIAKKTVPYPADLTSQQQIAFGAIAQFDFIRLESLCWTQITALGKEPMAVASEIKDPKLPLGVTTNNHSEYFTRMAFAAITWAPKHAAFATNFLWLIMWINDNWGKLPQPFNLVTYAKYPNNSYNQVVIDYANSARAFFALAGNGTFLPSGDSVAGDFGLWSGYWFSGVPGFKAITVYEGFESTQIVALPLRDLAKRIMDYHSTEVFPGSTALQASYNQALKQFVP